MFAQTDIAVWLALLNEVGEGAAHAPHFHREGEFGFRGRCAPGAPDGALAIDTGRPMPPSKQQFADCDTVDSTCHGQAS